MASITTPSTATNRQSASGPSFMNVVASEWTKLTTMRSTWITLALAAVISIGVTALFAWVTGWSWSEWTAADRASFNPLEFSFIGIMFAAILIVVLGVSVVTSEYGSGMMHLTLTVTPQRSRIVIAKAIVITAVATVVGTAISIANFLVAQAIFGAYDLPTTSLGDSDAFRAIVWGTAITTPVFPLLGVALAFIFRSTALAITTVLALIFAPSFFGGLLPRRWQEDVLAWLPGQAADSFSMGHLYPDSPMYLNPTVGLIVAAIWTIGALVVATIVLTRRDA